LSFLWSKETQKVHRCFRAISAAESKKSSSVAANRPLQSPFFNIAPVFCPESKKKPLLSWQTKEVSFMVDGDGFEPS
jgi:hypothetical protein